MEKYRIDIGDYVEAMIIEDMSELIIPIMEGTILTIDIIRVSKLWEDMMSNKALCYYHWMPYDPKLNNKNTDNESIDKKGAWDMFPGLQQKVEKKHADTVTKIISNMSGFALFNTSTADLAANYSFKGFNWSVICFGKYYILEAYFSH